ncbi:MAG TPA: hypothetical protein VKB15_11915, partial [Xanthobacteraceae bacterium]|nr:hypothetical protein [Xanthobacteraceae bacterium]
RTSRHLEMFFHFCPILFPQLLTGFSNKTTGVPIVFGCATQDRFCCDSAAIDRLDLDQGVRTALSPAFQSS